MQDISPEHQGWLQARTMRDVDYGILRERPDGMIVIRSPDGEWEEFCQVPFTIDTNRGGHAKAVDVPPIGEEAF